jgi:HpcH/HpaI aldolase/citrate lyase family
MIGTGSRLGEQVLADIDARLADTDAFLARAYPGEDGRRQPVHTVYVPADRYTVELPQQWCAQAAELVAELGGWAALCREVGVADQLVDAVAERAEAKLAAEPIEDLRLDFEDGYGSRPDSVEDGDAVDVAGRLADALAAGAAPAYVGLRFKCFEAPTRRRGLRTLDLFLTTLLDRHGSVPDGLVITFPKVSTVSQVEAMVTACDAYERAAGLPAGRLGFEIQVETPQLIMGADGRASVAAAIHAGRGRVTALHYGTYDYSASLQVAAEYQSMEHPVADHAKDVMQVAVAGTGVHLSDGSTNILPVGTDEQIHAAWRLHHRLVRRSLERALYQGWDLHPAQLPTRFVANIAFYREGFGRAAGRLRAYLTKSGGSVLDEPATARALARYLYRGYVCGAVTEAELTTAVGLDGFRLELLSRPKSDTENVVISS